MTALRIAHPGQPVTFDPADPTSECWTPYRNPFATLGGHKVQPVSSLVLHRAEQRRYLEANREAVNARKRGAR